jgi:hypothetical protein
MIWKRSIAWDLCQSRGPQQSPDDRSLDGLQGSEVQILLSFPCRVVPVGRGTPVAEDRSPSVHPRYTRSRQVRECSGHERPPPVTKKRSSGHRPNLDQATFKEAGQSSSLPTRLPRAPPGSCPRGGRSPRTGLTLRMSWEPSPPRVNDRRSRRPCHLRAISSGHRGVSGGQSRSLRGGRWAGPAPLTCGGEEPETAWHASAHVGSGG